jgi:hypothetical protein
VWPARPELTGASRYTTMVLRFRWFFFLRNRGGMGSHLGNPRLVAVNEKGRTMVAMSSLTLAAVGAGSTDWMVLKTGKTWTTTRVEGRRGVGSARTASQWRNNDGER